MGFYPYNQIKIEMIETSKTRAVRASAYDPILAKWITADFEQDLKGDDFGRRRAIELATGWVMVRMMLLEM